MPTETRFWFEPSADRVVLFFVALIALFVAVKLLKSLYQKSIRRHQERKLRDRLEKVGLVDRPEEALVRELVDRYKVRPPDLLLASLQQFDSVASEEIQRIEHERMDLTERLDRIEFLYSIRMTAFAKDPSVGGLDALLAPPEPPIRAEGAASLPDAPELPPIQAGETHEEEESAEEEFTLEEEDTTLSEAEMTDLKTLLAFKEEDEEEASTENSSRT